MNKLKRIFRDSALILGAVTLVAACGGGGGSSAPATSTSTSTSTTSTTNAVTCTGLCVRVSAE